MRGLLTPFFSDLQRVDVEQRFILWNHAFGRVLRSPAYWLMAAGIQVAAQVCLNIPISRHARRTGHYGPVVEFVLPFGLALLAVVVTIWIVRRAITRQLREELNNRGFPTCVKCGYNLTGNVSGSCPECGKRIST